MKSPSGLLLVDKPIGWTSFDVVNKIRGTIARELDVRPKSIKVGHSGTLDPMATGLLVLAIGSATKQIGSITKLDKVYQVEATLGASSDTGDSEGEIVQTATIDIKPSTSVVEQILHEYVGEIMQSPHKYSAIKIDGIRAYKLARSGKDVKIAPRKVTIYRIDDPVYNWPKITFSAEVSSGTYIRSLVEDIGMSLGTKAYMSQLRRTRIDKYSIGSAFTVGTLDYKKIATSIVTP